MITPDRKHPIVGRTADRALRCSAGKGFQHYAQLGGQWFAVRLKDIAPWSWVSEDKIIHSFLWEADEKETRILDRIVTARAERGRPS